MTTLILINKKEPTSPENFGSAFLGYDTKRQVKSPNWWVSDSPTMRTESLTPLAKRLELKNSDIIVKQAPDAEGAYSTTQKTLGDLPMLYFLPTLDAKNTSCLLDILIEADKKEVTEKNIIDYSNDFQEETKKEGFFSKLFGKKEA